jgi:hypothetical protein
LRKIYMDGLIIRYFLIKLVGILDGTILYTSSTTGALILDNISRFFGKGYPKITNFSFNIVNFGKR